MKKYIIYDDYENDTDKKEIENIIKNNVEHLV